MAMTNKEFYGKKPLYEALAKYRADADLGIIPDTASLNEWLGYDWHDPQVSGRTLRGRFYSDLEVDAKIFVMESKPVTGYLLEFKGKDDADYKPSEFATAMRSNFYEDCFDGQPEQEEWYNGEVWVGYFADMPDVFLDDGTTWCERCGVDFDPRTTPKEDPKEDGTWEGDCINGAFLEPMKWRVRKVMVNGRLGDKARQYFRKFPNIYMKHEW